MSQAFPTCRADVIDSAANPVAPVTRVAKDFGVSPSCLKRWLTIDDREWPIHRRPAVLRMSPTLAGREQADQLL